MPRKGKSKPLEGNSTYLFRIERIAPEYGFHVAHSRLDQGPYGEYAHTQIVATCLAPSNLSARETHLTVIGDRTFSTLLQNPPSQSAPANGVGTLTLRGNQSQYLGSMPFDALMAIAPSVLAGGLQFVALVGPPLLRGSSRISSMQFLRDADPEDY